jgi:hypothetical protein
MVRMLRWRGDFTLHNHVPELVEAYFPGTHRIEMYGGTKEMATLKETAKTFEATQMRNIAELQEISVDLEMKEKTFKDKDGKEYMVHFVTVDGEDYRVPMTVVSQLKVLIEKKPKMTHFAVAKSGAGLATKYQVVPL